MGEKKINVVCRVLTLAECHHLILSFFVIRFLLLSWDLECLGLSCVHLWSMLVLNYEGKKNLERDRYCRGVVGGPAPTVGVALKIVPGQLV